MKSILTRSNVNSKKFFDMLWILRREFKTSDPDIMDTFTNSLVDVKNQKWKVLQRQRYTQEQKNPTTFPQRKTLSTRQILNEPKLCLNIDNLSSLQLDNLIISSQEESSSVEFKEIIAQCIFYKKLPSNATIIEVLDIISSSGDQKSFEQLLNICEEINEELYLEQHKFDHFKLNCLWTNNSVNLTFEGIRDVCAAYFADAALLVHLKSLLAKILLETIHNKSEAVLYKFKKLSEEICVKYNDTTVLYNLWKKSFESKWYSDQEISNSLLQDHEQLRKIIEVDANFLCYTYLRTQNMDAVHRLIQVFLKYDMLKQTESTLKVLLDYQCYRKDLRAASETVKTLINLDIGLTDEENQKFLCLLLKKPMETPKKSIKIPKYQYKF